VYRFWGDCAAIRTISGFNLSGIALDKASLDILFTPLNQLVAASQISILLGMIFYALGFWARRIK